MPKKRPATYWTRDEAVASYKEILHRFLKRRWSERGPTAVMKEFAEYRMLPVEGLLFECLLKATLAFYNAMVHYEALLHPEDSGTTTPKEPSKATYPLCTGEGTTPLLLPNEDGDEDDKNGDYGWKVFRHNLKKLDRKLQKRFVGAEVFKPDGTAWTYNPVGDHVKFLLPGVGVLVANRVHQGDRDIEAHTTEASIELSEIDWEMQYKDGRITIKHCYAGETMGIYGDVYTCSPAFGDLAEETYGSVCVPRDGEEVLRSLPKEVTAYLKLTEKTPAPVVMEALQAAHRSLKGTRYVTMCDVLKDLNSLWLLD